MGYFWFPWFSAIFVAVFSYYIWQWTFWRRRGVVGPMGFPVLGVFLNSLDNNFPFPLQCREWTKKFGKIYGFTEGTLKTLVISDPELVHEVFVTQYDNFYGRKRNPIQGDSEKEKRTNLFAAQGFRWKRLRAISSPTFSNSSLRKLYQTVEDSALELLRHIEKQSAGGKQIDMLKFYQEFTLDVIGRIAMGQTDSQMFKNPIMPIVSKLFQGNFAKLFLIGGIFPTFLVEIIRQILLKNLKVGSFRKINEITLDAIHNRIKQREEDQKNGIEIGEPADFIDLFLDAKAEDVEHFGENNGDFSKSTTYTNRQLTTEEIVGQCTVFLIAGFDTTALSLSYATYLLATHPEIQKKLQEEVNRECPNPEVTIDQLSKLKYMECVFKEALRLYPLGAFANSRRCMRNTKLGNMKVEVGTMIQVDTWTLHTDPNIWGDDAEDFKPERWQTQNSDQIYQKSGYIPFGLGPRQCIGMRLAYMEEKILLVHILRKFTFETGAKTEIPLKLIGRATTQPESVWMHLNPRN